MKNKWELDRYIPSPIKRLVRQQCGFGCIFCGNALVEYHHSTTKYNNAEEHNPNEIVLLCGGCHLAVTRKWLSDEAVMEALKSPKCFEAGYSFGAFDAGGNDIEIIAGTLKAINTKTLIRVFGEPILCIDKPEFENKPFRISAIFCDKNGNDSLVIEENELYILSQNWDVEVVGTTIRIRSALRNIHLQLRTEARKAIFIERLNMVYKGVQIICTKNEETSVIMPNGEFLKTTSGTIKNCEVGIDITQNGIQVGDNCEDARFEELKISSKQDFGMNIQYKIV